MIYVIAYAIGGILSAVGLSAMIFLLWCQIDDWRSGIPPIGGGSYEQWEREMDERFLTPEALERKRARQQ